MKFDLTFNVEIVEQEGGPTCISCRFLDYDMVCLLFNNRLNYNTSGKPIPIATCLEEFKTRKRWLASLKSRDNHE